jgi:hypothetical protein
MNENLPAFASAPATKTVEPLAKPAQRLPLALVIAEIRNDSRQEAETYLRDTVVPHGGE